MKNIPENPSNPECVDPGKESKKTPFKVGNRKELFLYSYLRIKQTRKWWLLPILMLILLFGIFLNVFTGYNVLPAIYSFIP